MIPRTKTTFSPMPSFSRTASVALNGTPYGAFSSHDASSNPAMYVGTLTKLYRATNATNPNFTDASGATTFSTPSSGFWSFTEGDGYCYASNGVDPIQRVLIAAAANFAAVGGNAPTAAVIAAIQPGYLLCGNINDVTVGVQTQGIRWSALGDFTSWPLVGSAAAVAAGSDAQIIKGPHGNLRAIAPDLASCNAALFFEQAVFRMIYTGTDSIFDIQPVEKLRGTPAPRSLIQIGQVVYFLSHDGFYSFDGTVSTPIGADRVNKFFLSDCDPNYTRAVQGVADPLSGLCFWAYAGAGNSGGVPNRILVYNTVLRRFTLITGFTGSSLFLGRSFGTSLDGIDALGYTLDSLPYSLDSELLAGGRVSLAAFDTSNKLGFFSGPNMSFSVATAERQLAPGHKARVRDVRPIVEGGSCYASVGARSRAQDAVVFGPTVSQNVDGSCPTRSEGRYHRVRLTGDANNSVVHIAGAELMFSQAGGR